VDVCQGREIVVSNLPLDVTGLPLRQALAAFRTGQESIARSLVELFDGLEELRLLLARREARLSDEHKGLGNDAQSEPAENNAPAPAAIDPNPELKAKIAELESDRAELEEELESVRSRAAEMEEAVTQQKRQSADEHAQWAAELRHLRRILDKQATWIAQQTENGMSALTYGNQNQPASELDSRMTISRAQLAAELRGGQSMHKDHPIADRVVMQAIPNRPAPRDDAMLGSLASQFELLRKDVARRREQMAQEQSHQEGNASLKPKIA
jgi:hypothetical protein